MVHMTMDASFLAKCEEFLLHPRVREFSLADRVDFLEKKGLAPDQITAILKNVQQRNGLSAFQASASTALTALDKSQSASIKALCPSRKFTSNRSFLWKCGAYAVLVMICSYGIQRLRQRMEEQMLRQELEKRQERRQVHIRPAQDVMAKVSAHQEQYQKALTMVQARIHKLQENSMIQDKRYRPVQADELEALQQQVRTLKSAVMKAYSDNHDQLALKAETKPMAMAMAAR